MVRLGGASRGGATSTPVWPSFPSPLSLADFCPLGLLDRMRIILGSECLNMSGLTEMSSCGAQPGGQKPLHREEQGRPKRRVGGGGGENFNGESPELGFGVGPANARMSKDWSGTQGQGAFRTVPSYPIRHLCEN